MMIVRESVLKLSPGNLFPAKTWGGRRGGARRRLHTARNGVKLRQGGAETTTRYELLSRIQEPFLFVKRYVVIQIHKQSTLREPRLILCRCLKQHEIQHVWRWIPVLDLRHRRLDDRRHRTRQTDVRHRLKRLPVNRTRHSNRP